MTRCETDSNLQRPQSGTTRTRAGGWLTLGIVAGRATSPAERKQRPNSNKYKATAIVTRRDSALPAAAKVDRSRPSALA